MFTMRDAAYCIMARQLIKIEQRIGEIQAIQFGGQHPLNIDSRPAWYFEKNKHGDAITDIAIYMVDAIPWITELNLKSCKAQGHGTLLSTVSAFLRCCQLMVSLDNECGVLGDVSYLRRQIGHSAYYWQYCFLG